MQRYPDSEDNVQNRLVKANSFFLRLFFLRLQSPHIYLFRPSPIPLYALDRSVIDALFFFTCIPSSTQSTSLSSSSFLVPPLHVLL
jgi:hypothetical protein